jgi:hypothetical protein
VIAAHQLKKRLHGEHDRRRILDQQGSLVPFGLDMAGLRNSGTHGRHACRAASGSSASVHKINGNNRML